MTCLSRKPALGNFWSALRRQEWAIGMPSSTDLEYAKGLGAERILDFRKERFEDSLAGVDVVLDTLGGDTQ